MKKFSDFAKEQTQLEGAKEKLDDLLNKEIEILAFRISNSKFSKNKNGNYATVQFKENETCQPKVFFTGSDVLLEQLEKYESELPFATTIRKINRYYTLS